MTYSITFYNRETDTRASKKLKDPTADDLATFLDFLEVFGAPGSLTDWDIIDIHEINEEVTSA